MSPLKKILLKIVSSKVEGKEIGKKKKEKS